MKRLWRRGLLGSGIVLGILVLSWLVLARPPGFGSVGTGAYRLAVGDTLVDAAIRPFTATYRHTTKILGFIPISTGAATLSVQPATIDPEMRLDATIVLSNANEDRIQLDRHTLAPLERTFDLQGGGTVRLQFAGDRVTGTVTQGSSVRDIDLQYDGPVFEVSLFELVFASIPLAPGFAARLAWDNMIDADALWADVRVAGNERVRAANGTTYDTQVVHVRFASGNIRWFWIAREPPYKIRVVNFSRGRAMYNTWDLESVAGG